MLANTLTLDDASGDETSYILISQDATGTRRVHDIDSLAEPGSLVIKHSVSGSGPDAVDRHLVQFTRTLNSSTGKPRAGIVNLTIAVPRDVVVTSQIIFDLVANLVDLVSDGGFSGAGFAGTTTLTSLLRGES